MADNHDDELIAFERRVAHLRGQNPTVAVELVLDRCTTLYEQHDADQQQIAELRRIAETVAKGATIIETKPGVTWCAACLFVWGPDSHAVADEMHADDCPVTKARAWLDAHPR